MPQAVLFLKGQRELFFSGIFQTWSSIRSTHCTTSWRFILLALSQRRPSNFQNFDSEKCIDFCNIPIHVAVFSSLLSFNGRKREDSQCVAFFRNCCFSNRMSVVNAIQHRSFKIHQIQKNKFVRMLVILHLRWNAIPNFIQLIVTNLWCLKILRNHTHDA